MPKNKIFRSQEEAANLEKRLYELRGLYSKVRAMIAREQRKGRFSSKDPDYLKFIDEFSSIIAPKWDDPTTHKYGIISQLLMDTFLYTPEEEFFKHVAESLYACRDEFDASYSIEEGGSILLEYKGCTARTTTYSKGMAEGTNSVLPEMVLRTRITFQKDGSITSEFLSWSDFQKLRDYNGPNKRDIGRLQESQNDIDRNKEEPSYYDRHGDLEDDPEPNPKFKSALDKLASWDIPPEKLIGKIPHKGGRIGR